MEISLSFDSQKDYTLFLLFVNLFDKDSFWWKFSEILNFLIDGMVFLPYFGVQYLEKAFCDLILKTVWQNINSVLFYKAFLIIEKCMYSFEFNLIRAVYIPLLTQWIFHTLYAGVLCNMFIFDQL